MSQINRAIHEIYQIDSIASKDQWMNQIHPLVKLILTTVFITTVVSFPKYDIFGLLSMGVYLIASFQLAELSFKDCLWRLRIVLPIVCIVGIANPFFDKNILIIGNMSVSAGFISMFTLMMKGCFTVIAAYILIATTTIEKICYALRLIHIPSIIVTQILLTYRYITLLLNEVHKVTQAYALRAPNQKGIHFKVWGSLTGQLLLRSMDMAMDVYNSMMLRGFCGEFYYMKERVKFQLRDGVYLILWLVVFFAMRKIPVILVIGSWIGGGFR